MSEKTREPCTFADKLGRVWTLEINVKTVGRLRRELQFDVGAVLEDGCSLLSGLAADMERIVCVLACVLEEALAAKGVEPEDFGGAFQAETLEDGFTALVEAITDFFRGRPAGDVLRGVATKATKIHRLALDKTLADVKAGLDAIDPATAADELIRSFAGARGSSA